MTDSKGNPNCTAAPIIERTADGVLLHITCPKCSLDYYVTASS